MPVTEEGRHRLHQALDRTIGPEEATTLMEHLPPVGWADAVPGRPAGTSRPGEVPPLRTLDRMPDDLSLDQADRNAENLLDTVWTAIHGHRRIPVDPIELAVELGIDVFDAEMKEGVSGMLRKRPNSDPVIYLNRTDHVNRARFTCAHELGHYVLRQAADDNRKYHYVDRRDDLSSTGRDPVERYANRFAAALLMPSDELQRAMVGDWSVMSLAFTFKVSPEAMKNRLSSLQLP